MDESDIVTDGQAPATVGESLRRAREAAGLSREDVAAQTRIAERHLVAIEEDRFSDLAGRTYAVGFARAYARAVSLDEAVIAQAVRARLDIDEQTRPRVQVETFEPGDPARVPSARLAWTTATVGVLAIVVLLYLFWPSFLSPRGSIPDLLGGTDKEQPKATVAANRPVASGKVVLTATEPRVWIKVYDSAGTQLFQKEMNQGEAYALPATAHGPMLWTARPDALDITVDGKRVVRISERQETVKDVPISAAALLSRGQVSPVAGAPQATAGPAPAPRPTTAGRRAASRSTPDEARVPAASGPGPAADAGPAPVGHLDGVSTVSPSDSTDSE